MKIHVNELQLVRQYNLTPGDRLISHKSAFGLIKHHAIYLGFDEFYNHYMIENLDTTGVSLTRVEEYFIKNSTIVKHSKFIGSNVERQKLIQRALNKIGKPYSLINYNCEHFANDVSNNKVHSEQVTLGFLGLIILFFVISLS